MRWNKTALAMAVIGILCAMATSGTTPEQQLAVYTPQTSYSLPVWDRGGKPYIGVMDLLSPLGASPPTTKGKDTKIVFNKIEVRLTAGKVKAAIHGQPVDLGDKILLENGRLLVPLDAALPLLSRLLDATVDFHRPARRIFVGKALTRFSADFRNGDGPSLVLTFTQPISRLDVSHDEENGGVFTHTNRTTLTFGKDPVVSDVKTQQFGDGAMQSLSFSEENGASKLTVSGNKQLEVVRSNDGKTITLQPQAAEASATPTQPATIVDSQKHPPEFFVMIDPGHGGNDKGAVFSGRLLEKDITLRLARELRRELEDRGIAARLLRDTDIDLSLERRAEITNEQRASLYVAIHAGSPGRGIRVYSALLTDPQQPVAGRFLPWDSAQSSALIRSRAAARIIADELQKSGLIVENLGMPVRPLNNIVGPAIAVELAPDENNPQFLENPKRQNSVASAIAVGIAQLRSQTGGRQ